MSKLLHHTNELNAAAAFSGQAEIFDALYGSDTIINYKRQRVRNHICRYLKPGAHLLELNCGSGEDALFFSRKGFSVHATDISAGMLNVFRNKIAAQATSITTEQCSFTTLNQLQNKGPFDHIYSNFGGLNCTGELNTVLQSLPPLLKPGGTVTLVIISRFCLWESLLLFRGRFKTALRRFFSTKGRKARVEGTYFRCWYYSPAYVAKHVKRDFEIVETEGLCTLVPPSYLQNFAEKHPRLYSFLRSKEEKLKNKWPWKVWGDYFVITLRKTS